MKTCDFKETCMLNISGIDKMLTMVVNYEHSQTNLNKC